MLTPGYITTAAGHSYAVEVDDQTLELLRIHDSPLSADSLSAALVGLDAYRGFVSEWLPIYHSATLAILTDEGLRFFM
jgi:hypothetical protein